MTELKMEIHCKPEHLAAVNKCLDDAQMFMKDNTWSASRSREYDSFFEGWCAAKGYLMSSRIPTREQDLGSTLRSELDFDKIQIFSKKKHMWRLIGFGETEDGADAFDHHNTFVSSAMIQFILGSERANEVLEVLNTKHKETMEAASK